MYDIIASCMNQGKSCCSFRLALSHKYLYNEPISDMRLLRIVKGLKALRRKGRKEFFAKQMHSKETRIYFDEDLSANSIVQKRACYGSASKKMARCRFSLFIPCCEAILPSKASLPLPRPNRQLKESQRRLHSGSQGRKIQGKWSWRD